MEAQLKAHMSNDKRNFYFMVNPYFPTKKIIAAIKKHLENLIKYYPSDQKTISEKIKRLEDVDMPLIAVNGSCEAIRIFLQNYSKKPLVTVPNFNEWEITDHVPIRYDATTLELKRAIRRNNVDSVCICNPNNPTGYYREDIDELAAEFPSVRFIIDVSFLDFVDKNMPNLPRGRNIVLVKSLGKNYGVCGIRLGYIASEDEGLINDMAKKIPIWNINSIAEFLIDLILQHKNEYEQSRIKIIEGTQKMYELLKKIKGIEVYPTRANFVMIRSERPLNFNVKSCKNKTGLDNTYYRVAFNKDYTILKRLIPKSR